MARVVVLDPLSDLPDTILTHILSLLPCHKQVVRTCVLSTRWRFLWMSVPLALYFNYNHICNEKDLPYFIANIHRELYYLKSCQKIQSFELFFRSYHKVFAKHFDLWLHFATKVANVEHFTLEIDHNCRQQRYELPQFAYNSRSLKNLALKDCQLNPSRSVNWTSLLSLSLKDVYLEGEAMEKVLLGCPNLERLELHDVWDIRRLKISSVKMRELIVTNREVNYIQILAPYIQHLQLSGFCLVIADPKKVPSLVTAVIDLNFKFQDDGKIEGDCRYLKALLHCLAHVENLELGPWCIECLSILELKGWQCPPPSWKFLKLNTTLDLLDLPGIWSFLQSSSDLERLVIDLCYYKQMDMLSRYTNEDEQHRRFETHNFDYSFVHLKTIKIINFHGALLENKFTRLLIKYFLKNATVLESFTIVADAKLEEGEVSQDYGKLEKEFVSYPRSSPHASVVLSYQ